MTSPPTVPRRIGILLALLLCSQAAAIGAVPQKPKPKPGGRSTTARPQSPESLTNADVIQMVRDKFTESVIMAAIRSNPTAFDVGIKALGELKRAGVSQTIIEAMLIASGGGAPKGAPSEQPADARSVEAPDDGPPPAVIRNEQATPRGLQVIVRAGESQSELGYSATTLVQTKAKGDNVGTIMADSAVRAVTFEAITSVATKAVVASPGLAAIPIVGGAAALLLNLPGLRRNPTFTFIFALAGRTSQQVITSNRPVFEGSFDNITGLNPDEFHLVLVRVHVTPNNWRFVGAQRQQYKGRSDVRTSSTFIDDVVPTRSTMMGRGRERIETAEALAPGEYAVLLRPKTGKLEVSISEYVEHSGTGTVALVFDFAVPSASEEPSATR